MEQILAALRQLDPLNDDHWTANGDPRIDAVKGLAGPDVPVDRQLIVNAAPGLTRSTAGQSESTPPEETPKVDPEIEEIDEFALVDDTEGSDDNDATSVLLGKVHSEIVNDLLYKSLAEGEGLTDQQLFIVMGELSVEDLKLLVLATERVEKLHREMVERCTTQAKNFQRMSAITRNKLNVLVPEKSNGAAIRDYLESQNKARMNAAQQRTMVLRNISLKDLNPLSQLDQAMARKTARGTERPKFN